MLGKFFFGFDWMDTRLSIERSNQLVADRVYNFEYARKILNWFGLIWSFQLIWIYKDLLDRPAILFIPVQVFGFEPMPVLPSITLATVLFSFALFCLVRQVLNKPLHAILKFALFLDLAYLNLLQSTFGHFEHVGHIMVLYHFFLVFMPQIEIKAQKYSLQKYAQTIAWLQLGMAATYSISGFWKLLAWMYKLLVSPQALHWLHPKAIRNNTICHALGLDSSLHKFEFLIYSSGYLRYVFLLILIFQLGAVLFTLRLRWHIFLALGSLTFHFINALFFGVVFVWQALVFAALFFPYFYTKRTIAAMRTP